ncbi:FAD-dependent oxidoreductase [Streptomyces sp. GC420]|uniref:FAD-dependent oxidoreductase n=1 Tax=Streptomyces sp. GC420 TaxID=2697568 RepID=UPI0014150B8C|nr:FAD-dependent oxidoreductase [Streptomyces sp. GC420]NBM18361.1 FAD-dependent oxidoreductase [Streptomyces sp. GC420]
MVTDVVVVGGGVIGLTTAVVLAEDGARVRLWTRDPASDTTSAVAGALWWPYRIEPEARVGEWSLASLDVYGRLAEDPAGTGVRLVPGITADTSLAGLGSWGRRVPGLREARAEELPPGYGTGLRARLPLIDMPVHLAYLRRRLEAAGGVVEVREAGALTGTGARTVVNCTGLGARTLVPDPGMVPVRGQLVTVENPGIEEWFVAAGHDAAESVYFFPQPFGVVLGGTAEEGSWSAEPDPGTAEAIIARCAAVRPELADAKVLEHRVGLRPVRPRGVRIEAERLADGGLLVHNYGHGGAGVTVAWGCAADAARLVRAGTAGAGAVRGG